jgi:hypothetical protein
MILNFAVLHADDKYSATVFALFSDDIYQDSVIKCVQKRGSVE